MKKPASEIPSRRGRLRSMRVSPGFRDFVLDQLAGVPDLLPRPMFGGIGLYSGDVFFAIVAADVLYLKADAATRSAFEKAGASPFKPYADRSMTMPYYSVPVDVLDDPGAAASWAAQSIAAARAAKTGRPMKRKDYLP